MHRHYETASAHYASQPVLTQLVTRNVLSDLETHLDFPIMADEPPLMVNHLNTKYRWHATRHSFSVNSYALIEQPITAPHISRQQESVD